jgi:ATPase subunit of ABC transporter with duplicated ATPase domains
MGRNGAGKTTLLRLVAGAMTPGRGHRAARRLAHGRLLRAAGARPARPDAIGVRADPARLPAGGAGALKNLLGAFQFSGSDVDKPIRVLSGGEKSRLVLARMLFEPPNFLILDEPTNHLDLETKEMLVDSLRTSRARCCS